VLQRREPLHNLQYCKPFRIAARTARVHYPYVYSPSASRGEVGAVSQREGAQRSGAAPRRGLLTGRLQYFERGTRRLGRVAICCCRSQR
jgi:hypothetical protein